MNPKKGYESKIKKLEKKIAELEKKVADSKDKLQIHKVEIRRLKQRVRDLISSRDKWKDKVKTIRQDLKKVERKISRAGKAKWHHYQTWLISLCVLLRIVAGCSYGSIVRILHILNKYLELGLTKIPCENTIHNWVSKLGLFVLQTSPVQTTTKAVSLIIDESIRLGQEKLLLILSIPFEKVKQTALRFEDVTVVYMKGAKSWTGLKISQVLKELEQRYGFEVKNILSDEDSKLVKAAQLSGIVHVPDIAHAVATCLRRVFEKTEEFVAFRKLLASYSSKGVNQSLSYLCPPKQRTKARFLNLSRVVKWASKLLGKFSKLEKNETSFFSALPAQSDFIALLEECLSLARTISLPFKVKGLSLKSIKEAQTKIETMNLQNAYLAAFVKELKSYLTLYQEIMKPYKETSIHVSSEIIESMFGKYKSKANSYSLTGLTTLNLELPLYGMTAEHKPLDIQVALETISMADLMQWKNDNSHDNQLVKRRKWFKS